MHLLILLVGIAIFCWAPLWLQVLLTIINTLVPDPIPVLDELLMWFWVLGRIFRRS